jgi:hypothetical protein
MTLTEEITKYRSILTESPTTKKVAKKRKEIRDLMDAAGYKEEFQRQVGMSSSQYKYIHPDKSYYLVTYNTAPNGQTTDVKSWVYRGLGGNAKSGPYYKDSPSWNSDSLIKHLNSNKKDKPKTKIPRRSSEQKRRDNFVMYD